MKNPLEMYQKTIFFFVTTCEHLVQTNTHTIIEPIKLWKDEKRKNIKILSPRLSIIYFDTSEKIKTYLKPKFFETLIYKRTRLHYIEYEWRNEKKKNCEIRKELINTLIKINFRNQIKNKMGNGEWNCEIENENHSNK